MIKKFTETGADIVFAVRKGRESDTVFKAPPRTVLSHSPMARRRWGAAAIIMRITSCHLKQQTNQNASNPPCDCAKPHRQPDGSVAVRLICGLWRSDCRWRDY